MSSTANKPNPSAPATTDLDLLKKRNLTLKKQIEDLKTRNEDLKNEVNNLKKSP